MPERFEVVPTTIPDRFLVIDYGIQVQGQPSICHGACRALLSWENAERCSLTRDEAERQAGEWNARFGRFSVRVED